ncbi:hypothetical protein CRE_24534 [Caenorhabditis remanei]|uniref:Uncharacterized protein n=1 Tax=Caenorhabditis remanei TaxID=31234 RepID=E3MV96_CAERE|nr:hypothetical protein CRE_24534 [Caenorhabditis remanei]
MSYSTRRSTSKAAPVEEPVEEEKKDEEMESEDEKEIVGLEDDEDSTPPVLQLESPTQEEKKDEKKEGEASDLATVLRNCFGSLMDKKKKKNKEEDVADPFPKDVDPLALLNKQQAGPSRAAQIAHAAKVGKGPQRHLQPRSYPVPIAPARFVVGSNTTKGPARLLENRKREMGLAGLRPPPMVVKKATPLATYNGGHPGQKFGRPSTSSGSSGDSVSPRSSPPAIVDIQKMLGATPPVKLEMKRDGCHESEKKKEFEELQKETLSRVTKDSSNHTVLLGTMVLNGLNQLKERGGEDYRAFSKEVFGLLQKYKIQ